MGAGRTPGDVIRQMISGIDGACVFPSNAEADDRGVLRAYRFSEAGLPAAMQFNVVSSRRNVLRGLHAHSHYDEYYIPVSGRMFFALADARRGSPTFGRTAAFWCYPEHAVGFRVPVGIAHGVYFADDGLLCYGISAYWTGVGEFECRWDDADLRIAWPCVDPILSVRDANAGSFGRMVEKMSADTAFSPCSPSR